jgi:threonine aldolase
MHFASDNAGPAHPSVMEALARANQGYAMAYGNDPLSEHVADQIRDLFEAPQAAVYLVSTGSAANSLALACLAQPYQGVFCSELAHIHVDECNAPEFYTGGAKLVPVPSGDVIEPGALEAAIVRAEGWGVHGPEPAAVSLTSVTEGGNVLSLDQIKLLTDIAHRHGLPVHLDGARFANACAKLGCTPAEMSWRAGVDVAVFGGTKNGLWGAEAVIFFDPARAQGFERRSKRSGHLFSKHRGLAAQFDAYLTDDLWLTLARAANGTCDRLRAGLEARGVEIDNATHANMLFFRVPRRIHASLQEAGAVYALHGDMQGDPEGLIPGRLVVDWSKDVAEVDTFLATLDTALAPRQ